MNVNKETVRTLSIQLMVFILLIVILDIVLWVLFPIPLGPHHIHEEKFSVKQNLPGLKTTFIYRSGKYGIRSQSKIEESKPNNLIRVLCLGASTTQQPTQETQDTWCGILETKLRAHFRHTDLQVQTMAFGSGGFRASDDVLWIHNTIDNIEPDIVITLLGINDLTWNGGPDYRYTGISHKLLDRKYVTLGKPEKIPKYWLKKYSQVCRRMVRLKRIIERQLDLRSGKVVEWHSVNLPRLRHEYRELPYVETPKRDPDPIIEFTDAVEYLARFLKEKKKPMIMLGQPVLWKNNMNDTESDMLWFYVATPQGKVRSSGEWLLKEMTRYNAIQQSISVTYGARYIDLDKVIPKTLKYYFDDCHFTDLGSETAAVNVLPVLTSVIDDLILEKGLNTPSAGREIPAREYD